MYNLIKLALAAFVLLGGFLRQKRIRDQMSAQDAQRFTKALRKWNDADPDSVSDSDSNLFSD